MVPEPSLEHMLSGTEFLLVLGSSYGGSTDFWLNSSCVRSMENILVTLLLRYNSSSITNWCASPSSSAKKVDSSSLCAVGPVPWQGERGFNVASMKGGFTEIRKERATTIWGDAFRRPFAYRPLCYESPDNDSPPQEKIHVTPTRPLVLALLQLGIENVTSEEGFRDRAREMLEKAKTRGADIALMPEMYSVGYEALFPGYTKEDSTPLFEWMDQATSVVKTHGLDTFFPRNRT